MALLVGIIVGTYSSLFVAASLVAWMKERWEPDQAELARKVQSRRKVSSARAAASLGSTGAAPSVSGAAPPLRKKRKKR